MKRLLPVLSTLLLATNVFAQTSTPDDAASPAGDAAAGAAAGLAALGCGILPCIVLLFGIAFCIGFAVWVYKDATKRGMDNAILLTIVTLVTGPFGLLIYLMMRPKGPTPPASGM